MRLATLTAPGLDGRLVKVALDGTSCLDAASVAPTLQFAIENWKDCETKLRLLDSPSSAVTQDQFMAPLPRAWQWLDASAFASHGALMDRLFGDKPEKTGRPLMYQGVSDRFYGPQEDVVMPSEDLGIDFEGEFGVIVDFVPMGTPKEQALEHVKLIVQINDWSLRTLAGQEKRTGFGWVQAKPLCSMAPIAVTPDELGACWREGRVCLDLEVLWNETRFGNANGAPMEYGFHELIAHAARTRNLVAGTVIGSGTVSNENFREIGSSCIAERRGIEIVDTGEPRTSFMRFGDSVRMEAHMPDGTSPFGAIHQRVIAL